MSDILSEGFDLLEVEGYEVTYVSITKTDDGQRVMRPAWDVERCREVAFPKGTKLRLTGKNGYDAERKRAVDLIGDKVVTVAKAKIESWSSDYEFEEVSGLWNTVMFEKVSDDGQAPENLEN